MQRTLIWLLVFVSFVGLIDSGYLSAMSLTGNPLNCGIFDGCNIVASSPYAKVFGIPLAVFGSFYYVVALVLAAALVSLPSLRLRQALFSWSILGVLFSAYFAYLQYFVIEAICIYCVISAIATIFLALFSFMLVRSPRNLLS